MSTTYNCVIIDDEPAPREILAKYIVRHPSLNLLESFDEAPKALNYLRKNKPDIIFLDIEMPEITGIQLIERLDIPSLHYIFVTAHSKYATKSYDMDVVAFLTKPPSYEKFTKSVNKVLKALNYFSDETLVLTIGKKHIQIPKEHIDWIQADNFYVKLFGRKFREEYIMLRMRLHQLEELLPNDHFLKLNRSVIVNTQYIESIRNNEVTLRNGKKINISKSYKWVKGLIETRLKMQWAPSSKVCKLEK